LLLHKIKRKKERIKTNRDQLTLNKMTMFEHLLLVGCAVAAATVVLHKAAARKDQIKCEGARKVHVSKYRFVMAQMLADDNTNLKRRINRTASLISTVSSATAVSELNIWDEVEDILLSCVDHALEAVLVKQCLSHCVAEFTIRSLVSLPQVKLLKNETFACFKEVNLSGEVVTTNAPLSDVKLIKDLERLEFKLYDEVKSEGEVFAVMKFEVEMTNSPMKYEVLVSFVLDEVSVDTSEKMLELMEKTVPVYEFTAAFHDLITDSQYKKSYNHDLKMFKDSATAESVVFRDVQLNCEETIRISSLLRRGHGKFNTSTLFNWSSAFQWPQWNNY
jgi:hypothetical protein